MVMAVFIQKIVRDNTRKYKFAIRVEINFTQKTSRRWFLKHLAKKARLFYPYYS